MQNFFVNSLIFHFRSIHKLSYVILNEELSRIYTYIHLWKIIYILRSNPQGGDTFIRGAAMIEIVDTFAVTYTHIYIYIFIKLYI